MNHQCRFFLLMDIRPVSRKIPESASMKQIEADRIIYLGKEANKIEETDVLGVDDEDFETYIPEESRKKWRKEDLYSVSLNNSEKLGMSRSTLQRRRTKTD